jgi:uncharacterized membrane protein
VDPNETLTVVGAAYDLRAEALGAFDVIWEAQKEGGFEHLAVAVLSKGANGRLELERHDSSAKHRAWGGAMLGGVLTLVAPPVGAAAMAAGAGAGAGAGGLVSHFRHTLPKDDVREISNLLEVGESGLIVVAVNPQGTDIAPLLGGASRSKIIETKAGDFDRIFADEVARARAAAD